jgi:hypothetical protein
VGAAHHKCTPPISTLQSLILWYFFSVPMLTIISLFVTVSDSLEVAVGGKDVEVRRFGWTLLISCVLLD